MTHVSALKKILLSLSLVALTVVSAEARGGKFAQQHPRRAEVNKRERNQMRRIHQGVKDGTISKSEAKELRGNVKDVKKEERAEVKANGGYLTKDQQRDLNKDLNANSKAIKEERHDGVTTPPVVAPPAPTAQ